MNLGYLGKSKNPKNRGKKLTFQENTCNTYNIYTNGFKYAEYFIIFLKHTNAPKTYINAFLGKGVATRNEDENEGKEPHLFRSSIFICNI